MIISKEKIICNQLYLLSLLISVLGSILGTLILQLLGW